MKSERAAYYGPDEKLLATDTRTSGRRTFEEYRYDAFGRRIFIRSVKTCEGGVHTVDCHAPFVRRTIWDGGQELAEIQVPVDLGDPPAVPGNPEIEEMDTGYPLRMYYPNLDPDAYYGRVVYGPGLAVDQPLSVTRYEYRDAPDGGASLTWPRFSWQILWNYQGLPAFGTLTTGAWAYPYQLGQNQTSCPVPTDVTLQRCVKVQWPLAHSAYDQNRGNITYPSWHGSLLEGKRDRSGLEYKRNRQYDPATGRFTQEDPIGLAGGLNAYGFAAGDPVGNGDPFGVYCQRHGSDRMTCTGAPGDWWTISEFLGGATGRATFQAAQQAGLTRWSSSTCRGGFSDDACSQIAAGLAKLIVREIEQCSALGTRAAKRFEAGRFRLHQGMIGRHRDKTGLATPRILFWGGTTTLSSELFGTGRYAYGLQWVIAHEEMHHYLFGEGILNNVVLGEGPANDAGNRCGN